MRRGATKEPRKMATVRSAHRLVSLTAGSGGGAFLFVFFIVTASSLSSTTIHG